MPDGQPHNKPKAKVSRVKLTARVTLAAYEAITEMQRRHRRRTGKHRSLWRIVDAAIKAYAKQKGIEVGD